MTTPAPGTVLGPVAPTAVQVVAGPETEFLALLERLATNPAVDVQKLGAILDLQERVITRQAIVAFNQSFHAMEPHLPRVKKNGVVEYPIDKNKPDGPKRKAFNFAKIEDIDDAIRPILREFDFTLTFDTKPRVGDGGGVVVTGALLHSRGHAMTASFALPLDTSGGKSNLQGMGSSTSFGQRYCIKLLLNLVFEGDDDDGIKGGMAFLSDDQVFELHDLMRQTSTSEENFFRYMGLTGSGIHDLGEVEARDFGKLKNALLAKKKEAAPT
jgi:hypothetical protein